MGEREHDELIALTASERVLLHAACEVVAAIAETTRHEYDDPKVWRALQARLGAAPALPYTAEDVENVREAARRAPGYSPRQRALEDLAARLAQSLGGDT